MYTEIEIFVVGTIEGRWKSAESLGTWWQIYHSKRKNVITILNKTATTEKNKKSLNLKASIRKGFIKER